MEWKPGMKVRCIKAYNKGVLRKVGDILTLTKVDCFGNWNYEEGQGCIMFANKKYWEVVEADFTKDDLEVGMLVEYRNGKMGMIMPTVKGLIFIVEDGTHHPMSSVSNGLKTGFNNKFDIVKVYGFSSLNYKVLEFSIEYRELLWERKEEEAKEVTMEELEEQYGCKLKIVTKKGE